MKPLAVTLQKWLQPAAKRLSAAPRRGTVRNSIIIFPHLISARLPISYPGLFQPTLLTLCRQGLFAKSAEPFPPLLHTPLCAQDEPLAESSADVFLNPTAKER
jgi:hypothetical protein